MELQTKTPIPKTIKVCNRFYVNLKNVKKYYCCKEMQ